MIQYLCWLTPVQLMQSVDLSMYDTNAGAQLQMEHKLLQIVSQESQVPPTP